MWVGVSIMELYVGMGKHMGVVCGYKHKGGCR